MIKEEKSIHKPVIKWFAVLFIFIVVGGLLRLEKVQDFLIPGDPDVTRAAFSSFTQELKDGERFGDAAAVFCREIIETDLVE